MTFEANNAAHTLRQIQQRIERACERAGRDASEILLIGASKTVPAAKLQQFFDAGLVAAGENYVQEGVRKIEVLGRDAAQWHLIGALQSNKAREAVQNFDCVHSVDRASLANALNREAEKAGRTLDILLQVNVGGESSKAGCAPEALDELAAFCADCKYLQVRGLMGLPPFREDAQEMRVDFRRLRELLDELRAKNAAASTCRELSMGMSNDFEVAIEEGATMIRVGTALFGAR